MMCIKQACAAAGSVAPAQTWHFDGVRQILEQQPGLGIAFDRPAALEEACRGPRTAASSQSGS
jgi:hypothetical protein